MGRGSHEADLTETENAPVAEAETLDARVAAADLEARPPRVLSGRYELRGLIGTGGMGTVYRARDVELDEIVALKMLKKRLAESNDALARFRREVKLARRVTHKNVARTFDIGDHQGRKFLTMELVEGEVLRAQIAGVRYLPVAEAVRIATDICAGLAAAHAAGVIHRDLKPENVIVVAERGAVITDFGIARALAHGEAFRSAGNVVGTPAYMAPEQLENATLDERTDIYALGIMLYELLTGKVPWASEGPVKAALARLKEAPPDVRGYRSSLSPTMAALVARCLATRREDRFATATELGDALAQIGLIPMSAPSIAPASLVPARAAPRATLTVLPLVHPGDREHAYLADNIVDDLLEVLGALPDVLAVRAPATTEHARAAGRALGVQAAIEGSFTFSDDRLSVLLRMITVDDGFEVWADRFECAASELVTIADEASRGIAQALSSHVTSPPRSLPTDRVAYDLYLRGRSLFVRGWYDASGEAIRLFREAHRRCPENPVLAAAYARALARAYGVEGSEDGREAQVAAERAASLDPSSAEARVVLAMLHLYRGDGTGAASELARAMSVAPADTDVLELLGRLRAEVGPLEEASLHLERVLAREPAFAEARYTAARVHALSGDFPKAMMVLGVQPEDTASRVPHLLTHARLLLWAEDRKGASTLFERATHFELRVQERRVIHLLLGVAMRGTVGDGDRAALAALFPSGAATAQRRAAFNAQIRAELLVAGGAHDAALDAVADADANGLLDLSWLERCPLLAPVRETERFRRFVRSTGLRAARVRDLLSGAGAAR